MRCRRIALSRNHGGGLRWLIELTLTMRNRFRDESIAEAWLLLAGEDDDGRRRKAGVSLLGRQNGAHRLPRRRGWLSISLALEKFWQVRPLAGCNFFEN